MNTLIVESLQQSLQLYFKHGSRSAKKTDCLNDMVVNCLKMILDEISNAHDYEIYTEHNIPSANFSGKKRCDVVLYYKNKPFAVFPIKCIMSSYLKNRNNYYENLTGEIMHLKYANSNIKIIPINIILDKIPNLNSKNKIQNYEIITFENSFNIYNDMIKHDLILQLYNVIIVTDNKSKIGELNENIPTIIKINENIPFTDILRSLFN